MIGIKLFQPVSVVQNGKVVLKAVVQLYSLQLFLLQQIDGEAFLLLTQADIVKILSIKLGPALKIYNSILMLKNADEE